MNISEGSFKKKRVRQRKNGRIAKHSVKKKYIMKLKELPIFNDQLIDVGKFLGRPIRRLLVFVETVKRALMEHMKGERRKDVWDLVTKNFRRSLVDENKELWEKLINKLPQPTVQDNLNNCKRFICYRLGVREMKKLAHEDWPKNPPRIIHCLREEASVLGSFHKKAQITNKFLWDLLTPIGASIVENKYQEQVMSHFIDVVEFLTKHPEAIPLKHVKIYNPPRVYL